MQNSNKHQIIRFGGFGSAEEYILQLNPEKNGMSI